jgi:hypothetical protein
MNEVTRFIVGVAGIFIGIELFEAIRSRFGGTDGE